MFVENEDSDDESDVRENDEDDEVDDEDEILSDVFCLVLFLFI